MTTAVPAAPTHRAPQPDSAVLRWNEAALAAIRATRPAPPVAARALAILHTAIFDAWAPFDAVAVGTAGASWGAVARRTASQRTAEHKRAAVSAAVTWPCATSFPPALSPFDSLLTELGYADTTGYAPINTPDEVRDPNRWQPLRVPDGQGGRVSRNASSPTGAWCDLSPWPPDTSGSLVTGVTLLGRNRYPGGRQEVCHAQSAEGAPTRADPGGAAARWRRWPAPGANGPIGSPGPRRCWRWPTGRRSPPRAGGGAHVRRGGGPPGRALQYGGAWRR